MKVVHWKEAYGAVHDINGWLLHSCRNLPAWGKPDQKHQRKIHGHFAMQLVGEGERRQFSQSFHI